MRSDEAKHAPHLDWHKASLCQTGECVEVAATQDGTVIMRSSSQPDAGYVSFTPEDFSLFLKRAKAGAFDLAR